MKRNSNRFKRKKQFRRGTKWSRICLRFPPPPIQINLPQLRSPLRGFFLPICIKTFQQNMGGPFQLLNTLQSKNVAVTFNEVNIKK